MALKVALRFFFFCFDFIFLIYLLKSHVPTKAKNRFDPNHKRLIADIRRESCYFIKFENGIQKKRRKITQEKSKVLRFIGSLTNIILDVEHSMVNHSEIIRPFHMVMIKSKFNYNFNTCECKRIKNEKKHHYAKR